MNQKIFKNMSVLFLILTLFVCSYAKENGNRSLNKVDAEPSVYKFNVNNISTFIYADGRADVNGSNSGFMFPKGSNAFSVYESGFTWGGRINGGEVRFGGSTFPSGLVYGKIGTDPAASRMYRVRPDWATGSMLSELNDNEKGGNESAIREQYRLDWMEWPWQDAPYLDADGDGIYTPDPDGNGTYDIGEDIPGFPGAHQTIFFIANASDGDKSRQFYGSPPQQIEMQCTVWGYASVGPLGNMIFKKYKLFNKGAEDYTDFYVGVWCDPDLGNAGDDFVGCDTTLSLGFVYNANPTDTQYGDTPPAAGHDFFQGPIVPGTEADTALVNGEKIPGWYNLGMSAFYYFVNENGTPYSDPDLDNYNTGTLYFYNLLQGRIPSTGELFPIPPELGGGGTRYPLSGDPVNQTGYVDGIIKPAKDRRYGMSSGPFTLVAGDAQEIVVCQLVARGADNRNSVLLLKTIDAVAQDAYNSNFVLPSAPTPPQVTYQTFDQEIILYWDSNEDVVNATESHDLKGYAFQGYNVYQLPTASSTFENATKIATFDIVDGIKTIVDNDIDPQSGVTISKVVQRGNDTGIQRFFRITRDYINNADLFNGTRYYFAVTSYAYSADPFAVPNNLENTLSIMTIVPQTLAPGYTMESSYGDAVTVTHTGISDGSCVVTVANPAAVTGDNYKVTFSGTKWNLNNLTTGTTVLADQTNQSGDANYLTAEGLMVKVQGPAAGFKTGGEAIEMMYGGNPATLDAGGTSYGGNKVWHSLNSNNTYFVSAGGGNGTIDRWQRYANYLNARDFEVRFTDQMAYGIDAFSGSEIIYKVPFELWDIGSGTPNDASDDKRMIPFIYPNVDPTGGVFNWGGSTDAYFGSYEECDWIYWMDPEGVDGYDNFAAACAAAGGQGAVYDYTTDGSTDGYWADFHGGFVYPIGRFVFGDYNLDLTAAMPIPAGTVVRLHTNKPNTANDSYTFTAPAVGFDNELAKQDIADDVNVFPNPYYGANPQELNKYQRFVTFSHLPERATIRIFNLAGQIVTTIEKNGGDQYQRWDLLNSKALPVASGVYIAYIDMPDIGTTKILKLAIIQEQQILDRF